MQGQNRNSARLAAVVLVLVSLWMAAPLFLNTDKMAPIYHNDWTEVYFHQAAARESLLTTGLPPFWCPYVNGGYPLAGHPYDPSFSPLFPVTLALGEHWGVRVKAAVIFLLGVFGMALLVRRLYPGRIWPWLAATSLYAASGWFPAHIHGGNVNESLYFLFPLLVYLVIRGGENRRFVAAAALVLYLFLAEGKYAYPFSILFLFLFAALQRIGPAGDGARISVKSAGWAVLGSVLLGLLKIRLILGLLAKHSAAPPPLLRQEIPGLSTLQNLYLFARAQLGVCLMPPDDIWHSQAFHLEEGHWWLLNNQYIGVGVAASTLFLLAMFFSPRKNLPVALLFLTAALFFVANYTDANLFHLLRPLPVFSGISNPSKYFSYFVLFALCLGAGGFFSEISRFLRSGKPRLFLPLLLAALALPPLVSNARIIPMAFTDEIPQWEREPDFFHLDRGFLYPNLKNGYGVIFEWCGNLVLPSNVSPRYIYQEPTKRIGAFPDYFGPYREKPGYRGEAYFLRSQGEARLTKIGFNRIELAARALAPDILIVNQNFIPGWSAGSLQVGEANGLLAVAIPKPGEYRITLRYRPPGLYTWGLMNLVAGALFLFVFLVRKRRPGKPGPA